MKKIILATLILGTAFTAFAETIYHSKGEIFMNQAKFMNGVETDSVNAKSNLTFTSELDGVYNFDTTNRPTWQEKGLAIVDDIQNGKLTIKTNGTAIGEFTANQSTDTEVDISIPAAQIQSDWDQIDDTKVDFIKHKPTILTEDDVYAIISNLVVNGGLVIDGVSYKLVVDEYSPPRAETVFTLDGETKQTYDIVGTLDRQWMIDNEWWNESNGWLVTITSADIGTNVTNIGNRTFYKCGSLKDVTIPDTVMNIEWSTFSSCTNLTSMIIPASVTNISDSTFFGCSGLTNIVIPDSVTWIGYAAFNNCSNLTSVVIPASVISIRTFAFGGCINLMDVTMLGKDTTYVSDMGNYSWNLPSGCKIHCTDDDITIP